MPSYAQQGKRVYCPRVLKATEDEDALLEDFVPRAYPDR